MMMAISSLPTDTPAITARMTPSALCGIITARPPLPSSGPTLIFLL